MDKPQDPEAAGTAQTTARIAVGLPRLVLRLQQTRKFANAWKRLNDSGDIPKYFNATRGPTIWEVYKRIEVRTEKARLAHSAALKEWVAARMAQNVKVSDAPDSAALDRKSTL